jgi:hypothetical protein
MDNKQLSFLPFYALDRFMRPDYRLIVIRAALAALPNLPKNHRDAVDHATRKVVKIPGFRNGDKAPTPLKIIPMSSAFDKSAELVAAIVSAWAASQTDLRQQIFDLLTARHWELLPLEADRTKLPGFLPHWPKGEDFEILYDAYKAANPAGDAGIDNVSLMIVWLSGRLPYQMVDGQLKPAADVQAVNDQPPAAEPPAA